MDEYIINPLTGRKIKANGPTAKKLNLVGGISHLSNQPVLLEQGPCPDEYKKSHITGKCYKSYAHKYEGPCPENFHMGSKGLCVADRVGHRTAYSDFVADNFHIIKSSSPHLSPQEVMKRVAQLWRERKLISGM